MPANEAATNQFFDLELPGLGDMERVSLCEALDRVLNKGAVIGGDIAISVAGVELVYLGLQLVVTSVETGRSLREAGFQASGNGDA